MGEALGIYVAAMGYPRGTERQRAPMWAEHALRVGWHAVAAVGDPGPGERENREAGRAAGPVPTGQLLGIAYGYRGARRQWWCEEVRGGLLARGIPPHEVDVLLGEYFELTELHVLPSAQGQGLGEAMLRRLLTGRPEQRVLLSTPEVAEEENRAWHLYRRLGFTDVLRQFSFAGDSRPFAVLGRDLPL
ncbi:GNAT family N-acetyltransferase [Rhodococcus sp. X156]|uniref:GNAT family N-acetyltransferase n=1 Tax=Rhodococcus sp. X156 TaxID=2499145 RepID=UPI0019D1F7E9|nr:GNAT family N-acetyltransferase [Rhodococcus sp. X156]